LNLLDLLADLEQALLAETDALRVRDVDALARAVASKRRALAELARVRPAGIGESAGNAEAEEILARCRALNDVAGSAIAVLRQDTAAALHLLGVDSEAPGYGSPWRCSSPGRPLRSGRALAVC
jgi:hypothetical protein